MIESDEEWMNRYLSLIKNANGFMVYIDNNPVCKAAAQLCRDFIIEPELYGKIIRMMWSDDKEMNNLAETIINNYGHI